MKFKTKTKQLRAVKYYPFLICYIKNPSEEVQLAAIKQNGNTLICIKRPTERVQMEAININVSLISLIKNPTEKVIQTAILNGATKEDLKYININNLSDETKLLIELL